MMCYYLMRCLRGITKYHTNTNGEMDVSEGVRVCCILPQLTIKLNFYNISYHFIIFVINIIIHK